MLEVTWKSGMQFDAVLPSGAHFTMDATPEHGGVSQGPTPVEALLASAAACSAMDVVGILLKKRQQLGAYRIEVDWDRSSGPGYPRPVTAVRIKHILEGPNLEAGAIEQAVSLSDERYCTVIATLRIPVSVTSTWRLA
ncbi:MAG: OsmC family protein [Fimbriimonadaceae bacterium]